MVGNAVGGYHFNIDISAGLARIGGTTTDATGVLLVLDTKNTTGDPSGVSGGAGLYYNSAYGAIRCYENGYWSDCSATRLLAESTLASANGTISLTLVAPTEYLKCRIDIKGRSAASGVYLRFNNSSTANTYGWTEYDIINAVVSDAQNNSDNKIALTGTDTTNIPASANVEITNFADTQKIVDWSYAGATGIGTNNRHYNGTGNWSNTSSQISSVQFVTSTGTFNAGSHAWCEGRDVR